MKKALFFIFLSSILSFFSYAGDHSFSIKFEINQTAIDRALQQQYNQAGFPVVVNGEIAGITYSLHLELPRIILLNNAFKIRMELDVISSVGDFNDIVFEPTINIPQSSISTNQVTGFLTDLPTVVQGINGIPQPVKDAIVAEYNSFEPWVYPSKLINSINNSTEWMKQRGIKITNLTLESELADGKLILGIKADIAANKPIFPIKLTNNSITFSSPWIKVRIDEIYIYSLDMTLEYHSVNKIHCEKASQKTISLGSNIGSGQYFVIVLFTIDNDDGDTESYQTFYSRKYKVWTNVSSWSVHEKAIND